MGLCRQWWLYGAAFPPIDHGDAAAAADDEDDDDDDDDDDWGTRVLGAGERLRRCSHR